MGFLMESLLLLKQAQSDKIKGKLIERMYGDDVEGLVLGALKIKLPKAFDFYACLAQADPQRFYKRLATARPPSASLLQEFAQYYAVAPHDQQVSVIEVLRLVGESLKSR